MATTHLEITMIQPNLFNPKGVTCPRCNGSGTYMDYGKCFACTGKGVVTERDRNRNQAYWKQRRMQTDIARAVLAEVKRSLQA